MGKFKNGSDKLTDIKEGFKEGWQNLRDGFVEGWESLKNWIYGYV